MPLDESGFFDPEAEYFNGAGYYDPEFGKTDFGSSNLKQQSSGNRSSGFGGSGKLSRAILGSSVTPVPYDWLWKYWLCRGKLELIAGAPEAGKTTIALSFIATITTGGNWPDGTRSPVGHALIWSGEDGIKDTLTPRLIACGANMDLVHLVPGVFNIETFKYEASIIRDLAICMVDPVVLGVSGDSHKNAEIRRGLQPLQNIAEDTNSLMFGVTHFTKGTAGRDPVERITGSLAFGAAPRLVMATVKPREPGEDFCLVRAKTNIGPAGGGFNYKLFQKPLVEFNIPEAQFIKWGDAVTGTAKELLDDSEDVSEKDNKPTKRESAKGWLWELLKDGPVAANAVMLKMDEAGISNATLRRAKAALGVISKQYNNQHWWCLPGMEPADAHGPVDIDL